MENPCGQSARVFWRLVPLHGVKSALPVGLGGFFGPVSHYEIGVLAAPSEECSVLTPEARLLLQIEVPGGFIAFSAFRLERFGFLRAKVWGWRAES